MSTLLIITFALSILWTACAVVVVAAVCNSSGRWIDYRRVSAPAQRAPAGPVGFNFSLVGVSHRPKSALPPTGQLPSIQGGKMFKALLIATVLTAIASLTLACSGTPRLNGHWGKSVQTAKTLQTAHPQAGGKPYTATGMEGTAAGHAVDTYHDSFKAAPAN